MIKHFISVEFGVWSVEFHVRFAQLEMRRDVGIAPYGTGQNPAYELLIPNS